jgi:cytochrome c biogenesis factor
MEKVKKIVLILLGLSVLLSLPMPMLEEHMSGKRVNARDR